MAACAALIGIAVIAGVFGRDAGPAVKPLLAIGATVCALVDIIIASIFLAQFHASGRVFFGLLSLAYGVSGLLTVGYLAASPGMLSSNLASGAQDQAPTILWCLWHCAFPLLVLCGALNEGDRSFTSRRTIASVSVAIVALPMLAAAGIYAAVVTHGNMLPHLIVSGALQPLYSVVVLPAIATLNGCVCFYIFGRYRAMTPLMLWVGVATFSATLDVMMVEVSGTPYSYASDAGRLITILTAGIVLVMFLFEISSLYERSNKVEHADVLTSLDERRAFATQYDLVHKRAQRVRESVGLIVIDVDYFNVYDKTLGEFAGDATLRRVAHALTGCTPHPPDLVTRNGREEFAISVHDTELEDVLMLAERCRKSIENLGIIYGETAWGQVTISLGVAYASDSLFTDTVDMFETAERALFDAKERGGNSVVAARVKVRNVA
jgi:diguanylate cyclase (GGDEF)-like protein